jgi:hypothetical protein
VLFAQRQLRRRRATSGLRFVKHGVRRRSLFKDLSRWPEADVIFAYFTGILGDLAQMRSHFARSPLELWKWRDGIDFLGFCSENASSFKRFIHFAPSYCEIGNIHIPSKENDTFKLCTNFLCLLEAYALFIVYEINSNPIKRFFVFDYLVSILYYLKNERKHFSIQHVIFVRSTIVELYIQQYN